MLLVGFNPLELLAVGFNPRRARRPTQHDFKGGYEDGSQKVSADFCYRFVAAARM